MKPIFRINEREQFEQVRDVHDRKLTRISVGASPTVSVPPGPVFVSVWGLFNISQVSVPTALGQLTDLGLAPVEFLAMQTVRARVTLGDADQCSSADDWLTYFLCSPILRPWCESTAGRCVDRASASTLRCSEIRISETFLTAIGKLPRCQGPRR